jgi:hypothetical protein
MREDMSKVIVERPRKYKGGDAEAVRRRNDFDGPQFLGIRAGYGYRSLNENLSPLRRYLHAQVGRPWSKVYSEIASGLDRRNTVQQHVYQHMDDFIAIQVEIREDGLIDLREPYYRRNENRLRQDLYVDPRTGLIRRNKHYRTWKREKAEQNRLQQAQIHSRRRVINGQTLLLLLDGAWFEVRVEPLPPVQILETIVQGRVHRRRVPDRRLDVVMKLRTALDEHADERLHLYGSRSVYAVAKRQLSRREIRAHGLR